MLQPPKIFICGAQKVSNELCQEIVMYAVPSLPFMQDLESKDPAQWPICCIIQANRMLSTQRHFVHFLLFLFFFLPWVRQCSRLRKLIIYQLYKWEIPSSQEEINFVSHKSLWGILTLQTTSLAQSYSSSWAKHPDKHLKLLCGYFTNSATYQLFGFFKYSFSILTPEEAVTHFSFHKLVKLAEIWLCSPLCFQQRLMPYLGWKWTYTQVT